MKQVKLRLLGGFELAWTCGPALPTRKAEALMAYLAVPEGRAHRRDKLASLLWGDRDDTQAHHSLAQTVHVIRKTLGESGKDALISNVHTVALKPSFIDVDVSEFEALAAQSTPEAHAAAIRLYRGELFEGVSIREEAFEDWLLGEQRRLNTIALGTLEQLLDHQVAAGDDKAAIGTAHKLLALDPLQEPVHRTLMRLNRHAGHEVAAIRQYQTCAKILRHELGIEPDAATHTLYREIVDDRTVLPEKDLLAEKDVTEVAVQNEVETHGEHQEIRFCNSKDGTQIAYATFGSGPPLVKAPNWMSHLEYEWESPIWRHVLDALGKDHTCIRFDQRACGLSDWDVEDFSFDAFVSDLETVVDALSLERFSLLGISQGCAISIAYAVRHPERVSHLVLYGGFASGSYYRNPSEKEQAEAMMTLIRHGWGKDNPAFRQMFTSRFVPEGTHEQMEWFNELQRVSASAENAARLREAVSYIEVTALLPQVSVPTLILHCRGDAVIPFNEGRRMAATIPDAQFVSLEGNNHLILEHEPAWAHFQGELRNFLKDST
jgi:DNA-binding SARP family transcriptional activator/alpha-beta hydrolase superfamily lysophospholipase